MDKFISISKQTKKQQKEYYSKHRNTWNGLNPVTRTVPNGKGYNRNRSSKTDEAADYLTIKIVPAAFVMLFKICRSLSQVTDFQNSLCTRILSHRILLRYPG